jgi:hypothetical protein
MGSRTFDEPIQSWEFQRLAGLTPVGRVKTQQGHWDFYIVERICPRKSHWEWLTEPVIVRRAVDMY